MDAARTVVGLLAAEAEAEEARAESCTGTSSPSSEGSEGRGGRGYVRKHWKHALNMQISHDGVNRYTANASVMALPHETN